MLSEQARAEPLSQREGTGTRAAGRGNWNWFRLTSITQKERTGAHTDKSLRIDPTRIRARGPPEATTPPVGHRQEVPAGGGPRNSWRIYQQPIQRDRERESEREVSPTRPFCLRRRQDVAPRRAGWCPNLVDFLKPEPTRPRRRYATPRKTLDGLVSFSIVSFAICDSILRLMVLSLLWTTR